MPTEPPVVFESPLLRRSGFGRLHLDGDRLRVLAQLDGQSDGAGDDHASGNADQNLLAGGELGNGLDDVRSLLVHDLPFSKGSGLITGLAFLANYWTRA